MEEVYIEETSPKTVFKSILIILFILGVIVGEYYYFHKNNILRLERVVVELGEELPNDIEVYVKNKISNINDYELNLLAVPIDENGKVDEVGKYKFKVTYGSQKKTGTIQVKDTTPPSVEVKSLTIGVDEGFELDDFIESCIDASNTCKVTLKNASDKKLFKTEGTHTLELRITDRYGNATNKKVTFNVSNTESLKGTKENDFEIFKVSPEYEDFDGTITLKYDKCVSEDTLDEQSEYSAYLDLVSTDYSELREKSVYNQEILTIYNKYGYIIGFTVRLTFDDGTIEYVK